MRVLGIDPGYAIVGWGVVDYAGNRFAPVDFGAVCTDAGVPFERRLDEVYAGVKDVIERTQPEVLAIEKLFYQHNQTTVIGVAEARGVILLAAAQAGSHLRVHPMQVKQAVTGYGKAVKNRCRR
ncbi:MAG: crossover junction endodeoxyribonuclease RuvC [Faecalibacterium prausnitzii]